MRKSCKSLLALTLVLIMCFSLVACKDETPTPQPPKDTYTVTFNTDGGSEVSSQEVSSGAFVDEPDFPTKSGVKFGGWYKDADKTQFWNFKKDVVSADTTIYAKWITLNEKTLYLDFYAEETDEYTFTSLQELNEYAGDDVTVYIAPGVYWTDNPDEPTEATSENRGLIGITFSQKNLTFEGITADPNDVIIAGNRGQTLGAKGNWNTIGLGYGFTAKNITIGNYCNVDLVYERDPSQNKAKRADNIVQAQAVIAVGEDLDKWYFENCRFISFLNLFARMQEPHRTYYHNCFFQSTDDSIGTGDINLFDSCEFDFYGNHPSGSASNIIQIYLNCKFNGKLRGASLNSTLFLAKNNYNFSVLDTSVGGNITGVEWTDTLDPDFRQYVSNNTLNGQPLTISPNQPQMSVNLTGKALEAYKVGDEYNIYNLLREDDDWDPAGQKDKFADKANLTAMFELHTTKKTIDADAGETTTISFYAWPERTAAATDVEYTYDTTVFDVISNENGVITLKGKNETEDAITSTVTATLKTNGMQAVTTITILPQKTTAPTFSVSPTIAVTEDSVSVDYTLSTERADISNIKWYRSTDATLDEADVLLADSITGPLKSYTLTQGDVGSYIIAQITPQGYFTYAGEAVTVATESVIAAEDVTTKNIVTDFSTVPNVRSASIEDDVWYNDTYRPADISSTTKWDDFSTTAAGWTYGAGSGGAAGKTGLMTTSRGSRLLFNRAGEYGDMTMVLTMTPHKSAGQGFGSATEQYLDIYIKYDAITQTGYALRLQRISGVAGADAAVTFTLMKFDNGVGTEIEFEGNGVLSSAFMPPVTTVELKVIGTTLSAKVTTTSPQSDTQQQAGLPHSVELSTTIETNTFGGFGFQHTGTVSTGNRTMLNTLSVTYAD